MIPRTGLSRHATGIVVAAFVLVCVGLVTSWPRMTFWSPDCAAKFLQIRSLRYEAGWHFDVPYLGRAYDPALVAIPLGETHYEVGGGEVHLAWPVGFAMLVRPLLAAFGWAGLFAVPIAAGAVSVRITAAIAERIRPGAGWIAGGLVGFATPVLVYSVLLWEHTAALALALLALGWVVSFCEVGGNWRVIAAGAALGLASVGLRGDIVVFAGALFLALFAMAPRRGPRLALLGGSGFALGGAPACALNLASNGHLVPTSAARNVPPPSLAYVLHAHLGIVPHFLAGTSVPAGEAWLTAAALLGLLGAYLVYVRRGSPRALLAAMLAAAALGAASLLELDATNTRFHGWLAMCPVLAIGLLAGGGDRGATALRVVRWTLLAYCVLLVGAIALTYPNGFAADRNLEWGPRYWLAIFPLAAILAAGRYDALAPSKPGSSARVLGGAVTLGLLTVSLAFNRLGIARIHAALETQREVRAALREEGDRPLLTDAYLTSATSPEQFFDRPSFYVRRDDPARFAAWLGEVVPHGLGSFDLVTATPPSQHPFFRAQPACTCVITVEGVKVHPRAGTWIDPTREGDPSGALYVIRARVVPTPEPEEHAYATPGGTRLLHGAIFDRYFAMGEERSYLGRPTSDEADTTERCPGGRFSRFEHGRIDWCPGVGAWAHGEDSLGFPGRDE